MITPEEFKRRWGTEDLIRYDPALIQSLRIPDISKQFLIHAGLPRWAYIRTTFDLKADTLVPLTAATSLTERWDYGWREPFPDSYSRYRLLGLKTFAAIDERFDEMYICLDEKWDGKVVWIHNEPAYTVDLLNNTVPQLAEMLLLMKEDWRDRKIVDLKDRKVYDKYFDDLRERFHNVDPDALEDDKGWTAMIGMIEF